MNRYGLTPAQIAELMESLASCPSIEDEPGRKAVVREFSFWGEIESRSKPHEHVMNIVNTCANHTRGIEELADALWRAEKASQQVLALFDLLNRLIPLQVSWQEMVELRAFFALYPVPDEAAREAYCALIPPWQSIPPYWAM